MNIRDVLARKGSEVHAVQAHETVSDVLSRFAQSKIRCLAVVDSGALIGILTIRDVVSYLDAHGAAGLSASVGDAMTRDVVTVAPDTSLDDAEEIFAERRFQHLPVVDDGKLVGLVTPADVLGRHLQDVQETSDLLRDYIAGVYY